MDQVRHKCRLRHLARSTEDTYVGWIKRYIFFHQVRHPLEMGAPEVTAFLTHLAVEAHVATSTQNQAFSALLFLYRDVLQCPFGLLEGVQRTRNHLDPSYLQKAVFVAIRKLGIRLGKDRQCDREPVWWGSGIARRKLSCKTT